MRIKYNAPVTFTFIIISTLVLLINQFFYSAFIPKFFMAEGASFDWTQPVHYITLFTYVFGHASWDHLLYNLLFLVLLGPILEEKYKPRTFLWMMVVTTLVTSILNVLLRQPALIGSSQLVFMMILLVSFTRIRQSEIPISLILIAFLYLYRELTAHFNGEMAVTGEVSRMAHLIGGLSGLVFGFIYLAKTLPPENPGEGTPENS